jgi:hypothetical protein
MRPDPFGFEDATKTRSARGVVIIAAPLGCAPSGVLYRIPYGMRRRDETRSPSGVPSGMRSAMRRRDEDATKRDEARLRGKERRAFVR